MFSLHINSSALIGCVIYYQRIEDQNVHIKEEPSCQTSARYLPFSISLPFITWPASLIILTGLYLSCWWGFYSLEVLILTHLPSNHTSCLHCPQLTWPLAWKSGFECITTADHQAAQSGQTSDFPGMYIATEERGIGEDTKVPCPFFFFMACPDPSALPPPPSTFNELR